MVVAIFSSAGDLCRNQGVLVPDDTVLIVDDNKDTRTLLAKQLRRLGYDTVSTADGHAALQILASDTIGAVLLDVNMPGLDGIEVLRRMNGQSLETPVVMVSGMESPDVIRKTMREGAYDYLTKPWDIAELDLAVTRALRHHQLDKRKREYQGELEAKVRERTAALEHALDEIRGTYQETILALGSALETRDVETQRHALRVAKYSGVIAESIGVTDGEMLQNIRWGAFLHDIGKIGVPDTILRKPGALTESEWKTMKAHPEIGRRIIANIPFLKGAVAIIHCHHERYDGTGYPQGLTGTEIPVEARVFSIADALDAMLSDRPYRDALAIRPAIREIMDQSGKQFDPEITAVVSSIPEERWIESPTVF